MRVEIIDSSDSSGQSLILDLALVPGVPVSRIDVGGDVESFRHPPGVGTLGGDLNRVSIEDLEEAGQSHMVNFPSKIIKENVLVEVVGVEPECTLGDGDLPEFLRNRCELVVDSTGLAAARWTDEQND